MVCGCDHLKVCYPSKEEVRKAAATRSRVGEGLEVLLTYYRCPCGHWHLTRRLGAGNEVAHGRRTRTVTEGRILRTVAAMADAYDVICLILERGAAEADRRQAVNGAEAMMEESRRVRRQLEAEDCESPLLEESMQVLSHCLRLIRESGSSRTEGRE